MKNAEGKNVSLVVTPPPPPPRVWEKSATAFSWVRLLVSSTTIVPLHYYRNTKYNFTATARYTTTVYNTTTTLAPVGRFGRKTDKDQENFLDQIQVVNVCIASFGRAAAPK